jgi:hypothetical protein
MSKSIKDWLSEGEAIYAEAIQSYQSLETQIRELETKLNEKRTEVNQVAQMIGRPAVETTKRVSAQIVEAAAPAGSPIGAVTRALTGRGLVPR